MIITIDGPAGAGKSTAAKGLASRLGFRYLDTGAMYRAVTLAVLRAGIEPTDQEAMRDLLDSIRLDMPPGQVILNGEDVSQEIRKHEVSDSASAIAVQPIVREKMVELQRHLGESGNIVCEGRDQGTVVFPHAQAKFFLSADPEARAERRWKELRAKGQEITLEEVLADQEQRDQRDSTRATSPLKPAEDAILLDSTKLTQDEVLARMEEEARQRSSSEA